MTISYRAATTNDIVGIVDVFLGCWRESYAVVLPHRLIDGMTDERAHEVWTRVLREASLGEVIVAESTEASGTAILGVTRFGVGSHGNGHSIGMVKSLYVSPLAQGRGVGSRLLGLAFEALAMEGVTAAGLWVFRDNVPALGFYQRNCWIPDGQTRVQEEFGEQELRLARNLLPGTGMDVSS